MVASSCWGYMGACAYLCIFLCVLVCGRVDYLSPRPSLVSPLSVCMVASLLSSTDQRRCPAVDSDAGMKMDGVSDSSEPDVL